MPHDFRYMMATNALGKERNLSREEPDLVRIYGEEDDCYIGEWVTGLGFINVRFPKDTTRELTEKEKDYFSTKVVVTAGIAAPLNVRA